VQRMYVTRSIF